MLTPDETPGVVYQSRRERREAERRVAEAAAESPGRTAPATPAATRPAALPAVAPAAPRAHLPAEHAAKATPAAAGSAAPASAAPSPAAHSALAAPAAPLSRRAARVRAASASAPETRRSSFVAPARATVPAPAPHVRVRPRRVAASARPALATTPSPEARAGRRRANASRGLTMLTMAFVATVTIATSLPSSAFLTGQDMAQASVSTVAPATSAPSQSIALSAAPDAAVLGGTDAGFTATTPQQLMLAQTTRGAGAFTNDINGTIQWPFAAGVPISGVFGHRIAPCSNGCSSNHQGVDFAPGLGAPIQAIADGVVREAVTSDTGLGVHLVIDHVIDGELVTSVYGHMLPGSLRVKAGDAVKVGQLIGQVGNTGASTGAHLHLEIRLADGVAVDPFAWLQEHAN